MVQSTNGPVMGRKPKSIKTFNRRQIIKIIKNSGECSAAEISDAVGLSVTSINIALKDLLAAGVIQNTGKGNPGKEGGKRPDLYGINPDYAYCAVCHAMDHELYLSLFDFSYEKTGPELVLTPEYTDGESYVKEIAQGIRTLLQERNVPEEKLKAVSISLAAIVDSDHGIAYYPEDNPFHMDAVDFRSGIRAVFPSCRVYVNAPARFALYHAVSVRPELAEKKVFLIIGSEDHVGGAEINKLRLTKGRHGFAGEIGHLHFKFFDMFSAPEKERLNEPLQMELNEIMRKTNLEALLGKWAEVYPEDPTAKGYLGGEIPFDSIGVLADGGDWFARNFIRQFADVVLLVINHIILITDPDVIMIGGDYAGFGEYFTEYMMEHVKDCTFNGMKRNPSLLFEPLGFEDVIEGAAGFALDSLIERMESD